MIKSNMIEGEVKDIVIMGWGGGNVNMVLVGRLPEKYGTRSAVISLHHVQARLTALNVSRAPEIFIAHKLAWRRNTY